MQRLDPLLRELKKRSYVCTGLLNKKALPLNKSLQVLGAAHNINPKGGKQRDCFNMGRVFDFGMSCPLHILVPKDTP